MSGEQSRSFSCVLGVVDNGANLFVRDSGSRRGLPEVRLSKEDASDPEVVRATVRNALGLEVVVLLCEPAGGGADDGYAAVCEVLGSPSTLPPGREWGPLPDAPGDPGIALIAAWAGGDHLRPVWTQTGWFQHACGWAEEQLSALGIEVAAAPEQVRTWSLSSVLRVPTNRGDYYLKAVPPYLAREGPVTRLLAAMAPRSIPSIVAAADGQGIMLFADMGGRPASADRPATRIAAAACIGELQAASVPMVDDLLRAGAQDRRPEVVLRSLDELLEIPPPLMRDSPRSLGELGAIRNDLAALARELVHLDVPTTLVHGDLHLGNVQLTDVGDVVIYDWTDASVGCPLFDLVTLLRKEAESATTALMLETYFAQFGLEGEPGRAYAVSRPLAALNQLVSYAHLTAGDDPSLLTSMGIAVPRYLEETIRLTRTASSRGVRV
ncbi:MAG: phosphotransferase family protein [Candidatus Dormibacteria bacterium]